MTSAPPATVRTDAATDSLIFVAVGPLLAIVLGVLLIPLRESVSASNLSFFFVVLTIVVAAFGGRQAGLATAVVSALSMNFFLTQPYMTLRIHSKQDIFAFVGLAVCGLVAAALGSPERIASLREMRSHAGLLDRTLSDLEGAGPVEPELTHVLERSRQILPVRALVVRDLADRVVAACPHRAGLEPISGEVLEPDTLLPRGHRGELLRGAPPLPMGGGRLAIVTNQRQQGWLDLWGDGAPATVASRRTLTGVARIVGVMLARDSPR